MTNVATVSDKGQVTVPKAVRDRLGLHPGSRLDFSFSGDGSLRVSVLPEGSDALFGLLARPGEAAQSLADMDAALTDVVKTRARRGP
ncbi:MAG TPA: AbrB/MazE/SpoVT family DNA-binding domain-containing protein [Aquabacterium sp.]|nr:AbrB/MazE/SpoVT family DNA-binding domain-containing protein [Aquabacterium sp.]